VELIQHNLDILKSKIIESDRIEARQANAMDLSAFADETFDMTLVLGPMYHLYNEKDKKIALKEAVRVTKTGGYILVAYCMNEAVMLQFCFGKNQLFDCMDKNMITEDFRCISKPEDLFEMVRTEDIKKLTEDMGVSRVNLIATDGATNYMRDVVDHMDDDLFELYLKYHLSICERQDLIGATNHSLDILKKEAPCL
jgi:ubiquinone/menaquinone biosynthesis C-methylase UbiE